MLKKSLTPLFLTCDKPKCTFCITKCKFLTDRIKGKRKRLRKFSACVLRFITVKLLILQCYKAGNQQDVLPHPSLCENGS